MLKIIITGNRIEGKTTLAKIIFEYCKMIGYDVNIETLTKEQTHNFIEWPYSNIKNDGRLVAIEDKCSDEY